MDDIRNPSGTDGFLPANFAFLREKADALASLHVGAALDNLLMLEGLK